MRPSSVLCRLGSSQNTPSVPHPPCEQLLNAKPENVERESEIVAQSGRRGAVTNATNMASDIESVATSNAQSGRRGAVTIATNMAGRGTDILLGGNAEFMARLKLREVLMPEVVSLVDMQPAAGAGAGKAQRVNKVRG